MIDLGTHADFIIWSYAGVTVLVLALIAYVRWDARRVARQLRVLEERGIRRRSDTGTAA